MRLGRITAYSLLRAPYSIRIKVLYGVPQSRIYLAVAKHPSTGPTVAVPTMLQVCDAGD